MVVRVALFLSLVVLLLGTAGNSQVIAGGPPACPQPSYCPTPYYSCYPGPCVRPWPVRPLGLCGGCIRGCARTLGACLNIPSLIMRGLLAPPWRRCGFRRPLRSFVPVCGPAPPVCPPYQYNCQPPRRISKCRPMAAGPSYRQMSYRYTARIEAPMPPQPIVTRQHYAPQVPGCVRLALGLMEAPFRLVSGSLDSPVGQWSASPYADKSVAHKRPLFGSCW